MCVTRSWYSGGRDRGSPDIPCRKIDVDILRNSTELLHILIHFYVLISTVTISDHISLLEEMISNNNSSSVPYYPHVSHFKVYEMH